MIRKYQPQDLEHIMKIWLETNLAAHGFIPAEYWNEQSGFMNEKGFKRQHLKRKKRRDVRVF